MAAEKSSLTLKIYKTHPDHVLPAFATEESACFDLSAQFTDKTSYKGYNSNNVEFERQLTSSKSIKIMPGDRMMVPTGLIFDIPKGYSLRVHARSGTSLKLGLSLVNAEGVIDSDFVHEVSVLLQNNSNNPVVVKAGDRIAQAELVPLLTYAFEERKTAPKKKTSRNGGLGSTGMAPKEEDKSEGVKEEVAA